MRWFHSLDEIDQWQEPFGLNDAEVAFVREAATGEQGYSEALVSIDDRRFPVQVAATPAEDALIDFDVRTDSRGSLPGYGDAVPAAVREFQERHSAEEVEWAQFRDTWERLSPAVQGYTDLLNGRERYAFLDHVSSSGEDPRTVVAGMVATKLEELVSRVDSEGIRAAIVEGAAVGGDGGTTVADGGGERSVSGGSGGRSGGEDPIWEPAPTGDEVPDPSE